MVDYIVAENPERIFINPTLGCMASCSYCYLPIVGLNTKKIRMEYSSEELIESVTENIHYKPGKMGSIISIGCYTESWCGFNKVVTKKIMEYFIDSGNPVQLATKKYLNVEDFQAVIRRVVWNGQLSVYTSCSTISHWHEYEQNTLDPYKRFKNFQLNKFDGVNSYLYIKPVIKGITIQDVETFVEIIEGNSVDVIVGSMFVKFGSGLEKAAPVGAGYLIYSEIDEEKVIINRLSEVCKVYKNSTDAITDMRKGLEI